MSWATGEAVIAITQIVAIVLVAVVIEWLMDESDLL